MFNAFEKQVVKPILRSFCPWPGWPVALMGFGDDTLVEQYAKAFGEEPSLKDVP